MSHCSDGERKTIKIWVMSFTGNHSLLWKRRCLKHCSYPSNGTQFRSLEHFHHNINFYKCLKYEPSDLDFRDFFGHYRYPACSKPSCCPKTSPLLLTLKHWNWENESIQDDILRRLWECSMEIKLEFHVVSGAITQFRVRKFQILGHLLPLTYRSKPFLFTKSQNLARLYTEG